VYPRFYQIWKTRLAWKQGIYPIFVKARKRPRGPVQKLQLDSEQHYIQHIWRILVLQFEAMYVPIVNVYIVSFSPPRSDTLGSKSLTLKCFSPLPYLCNLLAHPVCWSPKLVKENSQGTRRSASPFLFKLHLTPISLSGKLVGSIWHLTKRTQNSFFLLRHQHLIWFLTLCAVFE
jgi:hypothetical protein